MCSNLTCSSRGSARYFLLKSSCWCLESFCQGEGSAQGAWPRRRSSTSCLRASFWRGESTRSLPGVTASSDRCEIRAFLSLPVRLISTGAWDISQMLMNITVNLLCYSYQRSFILLIFNARYYTKLINHLLHLMLSTVIRKLTELLSNIILIKIR